MKTYLRQYSVMGLFRRHHDVISTQYARWNVFSIYSQISDMLTFYRLSVDYGIVIVIAILQ